MSLVVRFIEIIDVVGLVDALNASPTRAANLKHKIYYFLSLITDTNDNYRLNDSNDGYHNICSSEIKKVLGSKDFYVIRELLLNPNDTIIEIDNSWHNPNGKNSKGYCQGYRITPKYNTGEVVFKTIPNKFSKVIAKYADKDPLATLSTPDYTFLLDQFEYNTLWLDPRVYDYVYNFGQQLLLRVEDDNPYQIMRIHNIVGRWLYFIEQIENGNIWRKVSDKNHRLNSSVTNLPKLLRPFLLCNGEVMSCVDVSSSQPYILSSIMKSRFFNECEKGYNLSTIYPELYNELLDKGGIDTSITYSSNIGIQYYTSHTGYTSTYSTSVSNSSSFMWCNLFTTSELDSINRYIQSPFYLDFYTHVLDRYYTYTNTPLRAAKSDDREKLKNTMMYVLFEDKMNHRNNNEQIKIFQTVFPGVERWINQIHKMIGKQRFSYLLQRAESYLLLNVICREFKEQNQSAPLITIHDGVFTTSKYVHKLNGFVLRRLNELTGVIAGCKTKTSQIDSNPHLKDVEQQWSKVEPIKTEKKYLKKIKGVFTSNIKRGSEFLRNFSANFLNGIDDQI
ncbi:MAG: hypothetical protein ORN50_05790 [Crocinitomicaceae bacterium]|nr:hypothetical protein [Crocinitomicaceae bacterium]